MTTIRRHYTAFVGTRMLASGSPQEVALAIKRHRPRKTEQQPLVFDHATGRQIDLDLSGSEDEILDRYEERSTQTMTGRGRPRLGVVAREVTLLPRHWDWLNAQPGGASVALRKLVEAARRNTSDTDRTRDARDAAYHFMAAMAGNLPDFEKASRALFAGDRQKFTGLIAAWPDDIRDHIVRLAFGSDAVDPAHVNR
jgi:hypothetical protein